LNQSNQHSYNRKFSHIYIEESVQNLPRTTAIVRRFPRAIQIPIRDYKEVFNRQYQDFREQKQSQKLILASKKDNLLYAGSNFAPSFGAKNFFYNSLILNCIYDCQYCYLQGMYPSANVVIFVNEDDFFNHTAEKLEELGSMYLCISYDTDLLAFEDIVPYSSNWITFASKNSDLTVELRTKSANYKKIKHITPIDNVILAWTLSPQGIAKKYENKTPSLQARLSSVEEAIADGWKVRLCFDPLLLVSDWQQEYRTMVQEVFSRLPVSGIKDVSIGVFRMNSGYLSNIRKQKNNSSLIFHPYEKKNGSSTYSQPQIEELETYVSNLVKEYLPAERIVVM